MLQEKISFVKTNGAELFCKEMGSGDPLVVLHGGAGFITHDYLLPHMGVLAKSHRVLFYDQRGLGKSTGKINPESINLETYVQDIEAIRLSLGVEKISLLGHSWGAFLAFHYAFVYPESIDKIILLSAMPAISDDLTIFFSELAKRQAPYEEKLKKISTSELYLSGNPEMAQEYLKTFYQLYMYQSGDIEKLNLSRSQQSVLNGFKVWDIFKEQIFLKPYDFTKELCNLQCPVLIIHGDSDPIPFSTAETLKRFIPGAALVKIDQCGHFPFVERPDICFQVMKDFLSPTRV